jgi:restriction system protein
MKTYTDIQIYSYAILLFFVSVSLFKIWYFMAFSSSRRTLKRYRSIKKLKRLTWDRFEEVCLLFFTVQGWHVTGNSRKGADGGVDLWMKKRGVHAIVQCKKYEDARVSVKVVREMYGLMHEYDAQKVFIVTTSEFTKECYKFIEEKEIVLLNGEALVQKIRQLTA